MTEYNKIFPFARNICNNLPAVLCFGHAGSYSGVFREWVNSAEDMLFLPVELPREKGIFADIALSVAEAAEKILNGRRYCIFGHSMGAAFAFETEYILETEYNLCAESVFVCGRHSPDLDRTEFYNSSMGDEMLVRELKRLGGTDLQLLENKEYTDIIIPFIREDYRIHESYTYNNHVIRCPLEADVGMTDISVSFTDTDGWRNMTESSFTRKLFSGGHFFLYDDMNYFGYLHGRCRKIFGFQE